MTHGLVRLKDHHSNKFKFTFITTALVAVAIMMNVASKDQLLYEDFTRLKVRFKHQENFQKNVQESTHTQLNLFPQFQISPLSDEDLNQDLNIKIYAEILSQLGWKLDAKHSQQLYRNLRSSIQDLFPIESDEINALRVLVLTKQAHIIEQNLSQQSLQYIQHQKLNFDFVFNQSKSQNITDKDFILVYFGHNQGDVEYLQVFTRKEQAWVAIDNSESAVISKLSIKLLYKIFTHVKPS